MHIQTHKKYDKQWAKLTKKQRLQTLGALKLLLTDTAHPKLRVHQLKGEYYPQFSVTASGDLRIHYLQKDAQTIILMAVGTHSQLYG